MQNSDVYTISMGKLLFKKTGDAHYEDIAGISELKVNVTTDVKEAFSFRGKLKLLEKSVPIGIKAEGTFQMQGISFDNVQKFLLGGAVNTVAQPSAVGNVKTFAAITDHVTQDRWHKIGEANITVTQVDDGGVPVVYTEGVDYDIDSEAGLIFVRPLGAIVNDQKLVVTYDAAAISIKSFVSGLVSSIEGEAYFVSNSTTGELNDIEGRVNLIPDGDYSAVGEDFQSLGIKMTFLRSSQYQNGLIKITNRGNHA